MNTKKAPARPGRIRPVFTVPLSVGNAAWRLQALCRDKDPELFFPEGNQPTIIAVDICKGCPVRRDCLAYAIRNGERYGVWGGFTSSDREFLGQLIGARPGITLSRNGHDDGPVAA